MQREVEGGDVKKEKRRKKAGRMFAHLRGVVKWAEEPEIAEVMRYPNVSQLNSTMSLAFQENCKTYVDNFLF